MLALVSLCAPAGYTRQGGQGGGPPQDSPRGESGGKDERNEPPDPCQQALKANGNANGLHRRCEGAGGGGGAAKGDFNGDGFADLAVGVPYEDQNGVGGVGGVNVIYGSAAGLTSSGDQFIDATTFGYPYAAGDHFGYALAAGDFNGDGFSDLAVGMPDADVNGLVDAGRVLLIHGSASGLNTATARTLPPLRNHDRGNAGEALVWADFNGDRFGDLAVGIPGAFGAKGRVHVYYGGSAGLTDFRAQLVGEECSADNCVVLSGKAQDNDRLGSSLAAGNFNGDTRNGNPVADLVVGVPANNLGSVAFPLRGGVVYVIPGSSTGLTGPDQRFDQDTPGVGGAAEEGDQFGRSLAVGDFNADLRDDLAIGVPFEDLSDNTKADAGAVHVLFGSFNTGELLTTEGSMFISQSNLSGVAVEAGDRFGWALAVGRFDDDFLADLAIGVPGEAIGSIKRAGIVQVLYGSLSGPSLIRVQTWHQDRANVPDLAEEGDQFGYALSAWNYGKGGQSDLAVGVPFEDLTSASGAQQADAGAVVLIYGSAAGLEATTTSQAQFWHQDISGVNDVSQVGDRFGNALY